MALVEFLQWWKKISDKAQKLSVLVEFAIGPKQVFEILHAKFLNIKIPPTPK